MAIDKKMKYEIQGGVKNYKPSKMVTAPKTAKSSPNHPTAHLAYITNKEKNLLIKKNLHGSLKGKPNRGPAGIVSLQGDFGGGWGGYEGGADHGGVGGKGKTGDVSGTTDTGTGNYQVTNKTAQDAYNKNRAIREANERAVDKLHGRDPRLSGGINTTGSRFGIGGLLRGALSLFGGIPGKAISLLSRINPGKLRGWNTTTNDWNTQDEYEQMVADRKVQGRIDSMTDRMLAGKTFSQKNLDSLLGQQQTYGSKAGQNFETSLSNIDKGRFGKNSYAVTNAQQTTPNAVNTGTMPGSFLNKVNDPSSMESGMQLSSDSYKNLNNFNTAFRPTDTMTGVFDTGAIPNRNRTNFNQFTGSWYADGGLARLL